MSSYETGALRRGALGKRSVYQAAPDKGLVNEPGQNSCFLNSAVQVLWHLDVFRRSFRQLTQHQCLGEACVFCALKALFSQFESSQRDVLTSDELRRALAETFREEQRFQLGLMDDAAECFENLMMWLHRQVAGEGHEDVCTSTNCIPHQKFAIALFEQCVCRRCGATSDPLPFIQMVHYVSTSALCVTAERASDRADQSSCGSFGKLLREASGSGDLRSCPAECGEMQRIRKVLMNQPQVVAVGLVWDSEQSHQAADILHIIGTCLYLPDLYYRVTDERAKASELSLVGMVCYYGKHYSSFVYHTHKRRWCYFDDAQVKEVGSHWKDVVSKCVQSHYQPLLLLYSHPDATPLGGSAHKGESSGPGPVGIYSDSEDSGLVPSILSDSRTDSSNDGRGPKSETGPPPPPRRTHVLGFDVIRVPAMNDVSRGEPPPVATNGSSWAGRPRADDARVDAPHEAGRLGVVTPPAARDPPEASEPLSSPSAGSDLADGRFPPRLSSGRRQKDAKGKRRRQEDLNVDSVFSDGGAGEAWGEAGERGDGGTGGGQRSGRSPRKRDAAKTPSSGSERRDRDGSADSGRRSKSSSSLVIALADCTSHTPCWVSFLPVWEQESVRSELDELEHQATLRAREHEQKRARGAMGSGEKFNPNPSKILDLDNLMPRDARDRTTTALLAESKALQEQSELLEREGDHAAALCHCNEAIAKLKQVTAKGEERTRALAQLRQRECAERARHLHAALSSPREPVPPPMPAPSTAPSSSRKQEPWAPPAITVTTATPLPTPTQQQQPAPPPPPKPERLSPVPPPEQPRQQPQRVDQSAPSEEPRVSDEQSVFAEAQNLPPGAERLSPRAHYSAGDDWQSLESPRLDDRNWQPKEVAENAREPSPKQPSPNPMSFLEQGRQTFSIESHCAPAAETSWSKPGLQAQGEQPSGSIHDNQNLPAKALPDRIPPKPPPKPTKTNSVMSFLSNIAADLPRKSDSEKAAASTVESSHNRMQKPPPQEHLHPPLAPKPSAEKTPPSLLQKEEGGMEQPPESAPPQKSKKTSKWEALFGKLGNEKEQEMRKQREMELDSVRARTAEVPDSQSTPSAATAQPGRDGPSSSGGNNGSSSSSSSGAVNAPSRPVAQPREPERNEPEDEHSPGELGATGERRAERVSARQWTVPEHFVWEEYDSGMDTGRAATSPQSEAYGASPREGGFNWPPAVQRTANRDVPEEGGNQTVGMSAMATARQLHPPGFSDRSPSSTRGQPHAPTAEPERRRPPPATEPRTVLPPRGVQQQPPPGHSAVDGSGGRLREQQDDSYAAENLRKLSLHFHSRPPADGQPTPRHVASPVKPQGPGGSRDLAGGAASRPAGPGMAHRMVPADDGASAGQRLHVLPAQWEAPRDRVPDSNEDRRAPHGGRHALPEDTLPAGPLSHDTWMPDVNVDRSPAKRSLSTPVLSPTADDVGAYGVTYTQEGGASHAYDYAPRASPGGGGGGGRVPPSLAGYGNVRAAPPGREGQAPRSAVPFVPHSESLPGRMSANHADNYADYRQQPPSQRAGPGGEASTQPSPTYSVGRVSQVRPVDAAEMRARVLDHYYATRTLGRGSRQVPPSPTQAHGRIYEYDDSPPQASPTSPCSLGGVSPRAWRGEFAYPGRDVVHVGGQAQQKVPGQAMSGRGGGFTDGSEWSTAVVRSRQDVPPSSARLELPHHGYNNTSSSTLPRSIPQTPSRQDMRLEARSLPREVASSLSLSSLLLNNHHQRQQYKHQQPQPSTRSPSLGAHALAVLERRSREQQLVARREVPPSGKPLVLSPTDGLARGPGRMDVPPDRESLLMSPLADFPRSWRLPARVDVPPDEDSLRALAATSSPPVQPRYAELGHRHPAFSYDEEWARVSATLPSRGRRNASDSGAYADTVSYADPYAYSGPASAGAAEFRQGVMPGSLSSASLIESAKLAYPRR
ncbi:unnamed protein product [Lampetra fluviatilis]